MDDVSDQPGSRRVAVMQLHARFIIKSIAALYTYRLLTSRRRNSNVRHCPSLLQSHHLNTFGRQQQQMMMMVMMMVTSRTSYKHALAVCFCLFILHLAGTSVGYTRCEPQPVVYTYTHYAHAHSTCHAKQYKR